MNWPPNKAWTCSSNCLGYRHFVAINYGGKGRNRWVLMVAVLDGSSRIKLPWCELQDFSKWQSGWRSLPRDEANPPSEAELSFPMTAPDPNLCLHPSDDSGFSLPPKLNAERPW